MKLLKQKWIKRLKRLFRKPKRVELRRVGYHKVDALIKKGWRIAKKEESNNVMPYVVWLELMEE